MKEHPEYRQLLGKARDAKMGGQESWRAQSTGEKLAVALVLNRADWLALMGYSIAEAIERVGTEWVAMVPSVAKDVANEEDDG